MNGQVEGCECQNCEKKETCCGSCKCCGVKCPLIAAGVVAASGLAIYVAYRLIKKSKK